MKSVMYFEVEMLLLSTWKDCLLSWRETIFQFVHLYNIDRLNMKLDIFMITFGEQLKIKQLWFSIKLILYWYFEGFTKFIKFYDCKLTYWTLDIQLCYKVFHLQIWIIDFRTARFPFRSFYFLQKLSLLHKI